MPIHDRHLRRTPFERALPDAGFPERHFGAIEAAARERQVRLADPAAFAVLEAASEALDELRRPDEGLETLSTHAAFLFHAYHHDRAGRPVLLLETPVVRELVAPDPDGVAEEVEGGLPASSYVQLPQHLVWAGSGEGEAPQSLDGFFWTSPGDGSVHVLAVAGVREDRPGFTVLSVPGAPVSDSARWRRMVMRDDGSADFSSDLPGAELEGLYAVRSAGEILKLGARLDAYLAGRPASSLEPPPADPAGGDPAPSGLPYRIVRAAERPAEDGFDVP